MPPPPDDRDDGGRHQPEPPSSSPSGPPGGPPPPPSEPPPPPGAGPRPGGATGNWQSQPPTPGGDESYDVVQAFRYGWDQFMAQPGPILLGVLVLVVGAVVVGALWVVGVGLLGSAADSGGPAVGITAVALTAIGFLGYFALVFLVQAGIVRAGLAVVDGRPLEARTLLSTDRLASVVGASLLVGLLTAIGSVLLVLPGIVFAFLSQFFLFFVIDRGEGAWQGIVSSVRFVADHVVPVLLLYLLAAVVGAIGAALCGIGLVVAFPVIVIAQAWTFRTLRGEPVAPVAA